MRRLMVFLALSSVLSVASLAHAGLTIDNYNRGSQTIQVTTGTSVDTLGGLLGSDVLGTERTMSLTVTDNALLADSKLKVNAPSPTGSISLSNEALVSSFATMIYDGIGSAGLGGIDLTAYGNAFLFDLRFIDLSLWVRVVATDTDGHFFRFGANNLTAGVVGFGFANFPGVDFTRIDSITVELTGSNSADLVLDDFSIGFVPEPSTFATAGLGLVAALLSVRKKFRRRSA